MEESILNSIKKLLGLEADYDAFNTDIIVHINSALMVLNQLGIGPADGYEITGATETWEDFLGSIDEVKFLSAVKTFIYLSVRLVFDPPTSSFVLTALKEQLKEYEWRLNVQVEGGIIQNGSKTES